ncbi:unnamed protein product [Chironomus riparius]|uniref:Uncharacterized protein n=1 Tax=Chironomus riparius TaxID=315576 RepID=A0A9N9WYM7_9DIPT|nr:unnamed protein product [Chironomus riparius]
MDISWEFEYFILDSQNTYGLMIEYQNIPADTQFNLTGDHDAYKTDQDVNFIFFNNCNVAKVPVGLTELFPNLKIIGISNLGFQNDKIDGLVEYKNYGRFVFLRNEAEFLPLNLIKNFEDLNVFDNNLYDIEPRLIVGFDEYKEANFGVDLECVKFNSVHAKYDLGASLKDVFKQIGG